MHVSLTTALAALGLVGFCSCTKAATLEPDAALPASSAGPRAAANPAPVCDASEEALPIGSIPEEHGLTFFFQLNPVCPPVPSTAISLVNTSDSTVVVDTLHVGEPFALIEQALPIELAPRQRIRVELRHMPDEPGQKGSALTVASGRRCARILLDGRAIPSDEDGLLSFAPHVLDFGSVAPGSTTTRELVMVKQPARNHAGATWNIEHLSVAPAAFTLGGHIDPLVFSGCAPLRLPVTFHAGSSSGEARGSLGWDVASTLPDGQALAGLQLLDMVATVE